MNIEKADVFVIAQLGNVDLLIKKLNMIDMTIENVKNRKDKNGISLLQKSIIGRKFDISKVLLDLNVDINVISQEGYNELHYIVCNLGTKESFDIAKQIIAKGGDLNFKDKVYGNSPFNYICQEAIKKTKQNVEFYEFISYCMTYRPELNEKNLYGRNIMDIINESGNEILKKIIN